jgi:hypothetical protein
LDTSRKNFVTATHFQIGKEGRANKKRSKDAPRKDQIARNRSIETVPNKKNPPT